MAFEEDFDVFFDPDVFGEPFTYTPEVGASVAGIGVFDDAYTAAQGGEVMVASSTPQIQYETAKINPAPRYGERLTVKGQDYTIVGIQPDGTGVTTLMLEVDDDGTC